MFAISCFLSSKGLRDKEMCSEPNCRPNQTDKELQLRNEDLNRITSRNHIINHSVPLGQASSFLFKNSQHVDRESDR